MRHLLIALLSLALAGCWIGDGLYADGDARPPLAPGVYRMIIPGDPPREIRLSVLSSGLTQLSRDGSNDTDVYGFAPLDSARGAFVAWHSDNEAKPNEQLYFLARKRADGSLAIYVPYCDGEEAAIARRAGALVEQANYAGRCRFPTKIALERALQQIHPTEREQLMTLTPRR